MARQPGQGDCYTGDNDDPARLSPGNEPAMQITLPPDVQAIIENEIESGRFTSAEEVVVEAVRHLQDATTPSVPDDWLVEARDQADRGQVVPWTDDFMERAAQRAREKSAQGHQVRDDIKY